MKKYYDYFKAFIPTLNECFKKGNIETKKDIKRYVYQNIHLKDSEKDSIWKKIVK